MLFGVGRRFDFATVGGSDEIASDKPCGCRGRTRFDFDDAHPVGGFDETTTECVHQIGGMVGTCGWLRTIGIRSNGNDLLIEIALSRALVLLNHGRTLNLSELIEHPADARSESVFVVGAFDFANERGKSLLMHAIGCFRRFLELR